MSYYDRPYRRRIISPFDEMMDAFNRFNESFYHFSEAMDPRFQAMQERERMERIEDKALEKRRQKLQEKEPEKKLQVTKAAEKRDQPAKELLERPMKDVLVSFEEPFFKGDWEAHATFDRAHKILDDMIAKGKPDINLTKDDELLKVPDEIEDVYRELGAKGESKVTGKSYQTSNITRDGKTVTVLRESKLHPDGSISTKVSQFFDDGKGQSETKSRKKKINFKTGEVTDKILDKPEKKLIPLCIECQKPMISTKKEESIKKEESREKKESAAK